MALRMRSSLQSCHRSPSPSPSLPMPKLKPILILIPIPIAIPNIPTPNLGQHSEETLWQLKCSRSAQNLRLSRARQMSSQPAAAGR
ncbi:GD12466 [Drosophila simulans]|uniref:GD12466 n=1 Tax=Drosophila simulans TaxID=7240 RepID=B4QMU0_DROSI|nr:GD12466 [Drosophila simulans]